MRDIIVTLIVVGAIPYVLMRPHIGILLWSWIGYMNPHRLAWGFATTMPFAQIIAIATLISFVASKEPRTFPWTRETVLLLIFVAWMFITTLFALNSEGAWFQWDKVWKIQLMTFVTMLVINTEQRLHQLIWIICLSLGFYGIKGGVFTILTGGSYHVWGPSNTFIGGNNEIGLAFIMLFPLLRYLHLTSERTWLKMGLLGSMVLTFASILGTQSRGALVGVVVMGGILLFKSRKKALFIPLIIVLALLGYQFMPESWHDRMSTIKTYEEDASAMGRINAWGFAMNLAMDRPILGGGFETFRPWIFYQYAPDPNAFHDAHSIYFEVLAEHGFIGLGLFLSLLGATFFSAGRCVKLAKLQGNKRMADMMSMIQVSLIGYGSAGAFLGLAYFDLVYHLIAITIVGKTLLIRLVAVSNTTDNRVEITS